MIVYIENPIESTKKLLTKQWIRQSSGIQSHYSEIDGIFVHQTMNYQKEKLRKYLLLQQQQK